MKIKNISNLSKEELEYLYIEALNSLVDKNELTEVQKAQLLKYANAKLKAIEQGVFNAINHGFVTIKMLGGDLEFYLKKETAQPQRVIDWLTEAEHDLPPQPIVKQKHGQETPKTFDELFYNTDLVTPCIDILKELDPPLIDTDCNYIGKLKGAICVWIDEMQRQGIVKKYSDRKIFASLIPQKIKRFSIDESMFGKHQGKAEDLYRTDIKTKVSKIKLSQNSQ